ncbi:MAG: 2-dehydropantoate 2-reductase [Rhodospirillaceae bacterium]|nr:2-dehydropantoate 2-reductase [Rhodospirillaceae bacterium]MBT7292434.1 2-dehydropantoate 2-reductase [Rhodospirillaceae bacterium]
MKLCIFGAGAIGAYLGVELKRGGVDVTLIARGPHLQAMKKNGVTLRIGDEEHTEHPNCSDDPTEVGPQDYVLVTLKAHSVPGVSAAMQPLLGPKSAVVTAVNGIPWWYFHKLEGPWQDHRVKMVDPDDVQWQSLGPERAIGCVVYPAAEIVAPGIVEVQPHLSQNRLPIGEPDGSRSERAKALSEVLISAGFKAPVRTDIRSDIWVKLWGNLAFNPISALTGATLEDIAKDAETRALARAMMVEGQAVAEKLGARFAIDVDKRINGAEQVGAHRTSMLQDLSLGRPMEIDALVGAVAELGRLVGIATPTIDAVYALVRRRAIEAGCYPG